MTKVTSVKTTLVIFGCLGVLAFQHSRARRVAEMTSDAYFRLGSILGGTLVAVGVLALAALLVILVR